MARRPRYGLYSLPMVLLLLALGCHQEHVPASRTRVAVPPSVLGAFQSYGPARGSGLVFVALRPYSRARDLEVLLFSSRSTAFQGVVIPGRYLPLLKQWVSPFPKGSLDGIRSDVAESVSGDQALALPMTLDFGVMVTRSDLWKSYALPSPSNLAGLREAALALRSRAVGITEPIVSDLPVDELFWDLGWSFEGDGSSSLYTFPNVHALEFIREFALGRADRGTESVAKLLSDGRAAIAFTSLQRALELCKKDRRLSASPLPARSGRALAIYSGWCLAKLSGNSADSDALVTLEEPPFQSHLGRSGLISVRRAGEPPPVEIDFALRRTEVKGAPDLGAGGDEIVVEALRDATETGMTAEEALRRGAARLERIQRGRG